MQMKMSNWKTTGEGGKLPGVVATAGGRGGGPTVARGGCSR